MLAAVPAVVPAVVPDVVGDVLDEDVPDVGETRRTKFEPECEAVLLAVPLVAVVPLVPVAPDIADESRSMHPVTVM